MQGEVQHGMIVWEAVLGVAELSRAGGSPAGRDEDVQSSSSSLVLHLLDCLPLDLADFVVVRIKHKDADVM